MSPKSATISLPLLFLTLASLTLFSAAKCPYPSLPDLLEDFKLPGGIFPTVKNFSCANATSHPEDNILLLDIILPKNCEATDYKSVSSVNISVKYESEISGIIYSRKLQISSGVTVYVHSDLPPNQDHGLKYKVGAVQAQEYSTVPMLQLYSDDDEPIFPIPFKFNLSFPLPCNQYSAPAALDYYSGSARAIAAKDNQDVPMLVYKYGRLLPLVAA